MQRAVIMRLYLIFPAVLALASAGCASSHERPGVTSMQPASAGDEASGWRHYRAGERLEEAGRTDRAALEFRRSEEAFGDRFLTERSMAIYARARALDLAGRCNEAQDVYHEYADFVGTRDPASAKAALTVGLECRQVPDDDRTLTTVTLALRNRDYPRALALIERTEPSTRLNNAWLAYDRGEALLGLNRVDEALVSFEIAEQRFEQAGQAARGRPLVTWSKGRALVAAGRCKEARRAYGDYARLVRGSDPQGADMAIHAAAHCTEVESSR